MSHLYKTFFIFIVVVVIGSVCYYATQYTIHYYGFTMDRGITFVTKCDKESLVKNTVEILNVSRVLPASLTHHASKVPPVHHASKVHPVHRASKTSPVPLTSRASKSPPEPSKDPPIPPTKRTPRAWKSPLIPPMPATKQTSSASKLHVIRRTGSPVPPPVPLVPMTPLAPRKALYTSDVYHLLDVPPPHYLANLKSPCWLHREMIKDPTYVNKQDQMTHTAKTTSLSLKCLPNFFIAGFDKCGTSDMFNRLKQHPNIVENCHKEQHYFNNLSPFYVNRPDRQPFGKYIDCFSELSKRYTAWYNSNKTVAPPNLIAMDASAGTIWRSINLTSPHRDQRYIIRHLMPHAKFVVMLRNPVTRTYSDYNYRNDGSTNGGQSHKIPTSPALFHKIVKAFIWQYTTCIKTHSQQECIERVDRDPSFNKTVYAFYPIVDFYAYYIKKWLEVYPRERFLFIKLEDYHKNVLSTLRTVAQFLGIDDSREVLQSLMETNRKNRGHYNVPMYNTTRALLQEFYRPYNQQLAHLLKDDRFLWS